MSPATRTLALVAAVAGAACSAGPAATSSDANPLLPQPSEHAGASHGAATHRSPQLERALAELRRTTAPFHNFEKAVEAGYAARITPCWEHRAEGAMGYHYGNPDLIDGTVELLKPELLMYEPGPGGQLRLVGMEYIVPIEAWTGDAPPTLLGQELHPHSSLPIYKLHIWLWKDNPRGIFADWNPSVSCRHAEETEFFG